MASFRLRVLGLTFMAAVLALVAGLAPESGMAAQQVELKPPPAVDKVMPESLEDLRAIQNHVKVLSAKVMPSVVNVKIGAQGSGVVISEDGYVLTAGHVSGQPGRDCTLTFADGKQVKGKSFGQNVGADTGLIKIMEDGKWPYCEMGKSGDMKKGQWVVAIGHPGGLKQGRTPPVRLGRVVALPTGPNTFITTECTLVGGDSGGPLFDMEGKVVGIHSRIGNSITANMHVPVDTYRAEWERLAKGESWGGAGGGKGGKGKGQPKTPPGRLDGVEFADAKELKVAKVAADSGAEKAGLKVGDIITAINDKKVGTPDEWRTEIGRGKAGDAITIEVRRGTETLTLKATLDKAGG